MPAAPSALSTSLVEFLEAADVVTVRGAPDATLPGRLALAKEHDARVWALMDVVVRRATSYCFGEVRIFPAVFTRRPFAQGAATDEEVCLGENGAGDLHLWDARDGSVRTLRHDGDGGAERHVASVDAWLEDRLFRSLEALEVDEIEELAALPPPERARFELAVDLLGRAALRPDVIKALRAAGLRAPARR